MKTIIFPGYSLRNKKWADDTAGRLNLESDIIVHNWKHWKNGGSLSIKYELRKILEEIGDNRVNILAKSVGSRIAIRVLPELKCRVSKFILTGIASISKDTKKAYQNALADFPPEKIICFQNTKDPFVPYSDVKKFIQEVNPKIKVIEKPRSDHHYPYYEDFQNFLK